MMFKIKGSLRPHKKLSMLVAFIGIIGFCTLLALLVWKLGTGGNVTDISSLKLLQLCQSIGIFVIPPVVLAYLYSGKPLSELHLNGKSNWPIYIGVIISMILLIPFINLVVHINHLIVLPAWLSEIEQEMKLAEMETSKFTQTFLNVSDFEGLLFNILLIAIIPALGEELFFRGSIFSMTSRWKGAIRGIWITAFAFSFIHFQFYGFIPRMLLGAYFGYLILWSQNMWLPITAHFVNNVMAVILYYLHYNGYLMIDIDKIGIENTSWVGVVSGVLSMLSIFWIKYNLQKRTDKTT